MPRHEYRDSPAVGGPAFGAEATDYPQPYGGGWPYEGRSPVPGERPGPAGAGSAGPGSVPGLGLLGAPRGGDAAASSPVAGRPTAVSPGRRRPAGGRRSAGWRAFARPVHQGLLLMIVLGVLVPLVVSTGLFWTQSGSVLGPTQSERHGVAYLRPVMRLLAAATDQQSADVAGAAGKGDQLRAAMRGVDAVDALLGDEFDTHDRWSNLRRRLNVLLDSPPAPAAAYQEFGQSIDLITALITTVGDRSSLILDPDLDTYYLMDATVLRLPAMMVSAGRMSDLARTPSGARSAGVIILAQGLVGNAGALANGLRKSFAATRTGSLTPGLISALDQFSDAATTMVPGLTGQGTVSLPSAARLAADRDRVRDAALTLADTAFTQLDNQLQVRADGVQSQRTLIVGITLIGVLLAGFGGWLLLRRRRSDPAGAASGGGGAAQTRRPASGPDGPGPAATSGSVGGFPALIGAGRQDQARGSTP